MDRVSADKKIRLTVIFCILGVIASIGSVYLTEPLGFDIHLFTPWLFPGRLAVPLIAVVLLLAIAVYRRSRTAAVLLVVLYVLDRLFVLIWLHGFSDVFLIAWVALALIWILGFIPGIQGTFAYARLSSESRARPG